MASLRDEIKLRYQAYILLSLLIKRTRLQIDCLSEGKIEVENEIDEYHNVWHTLKNGTNSLTAAVVDTTSTTLKSVSALSLLLGRMVTSSLLFLGSLKLNLLSYSFRKPENTEKKIIAEKENQKNFLMSKLRYIKKFNISLNTIQNSFDHYENLSKLKALVFQASIKDLDNDCSDTSLLLHRLGIKKTELLSLLQPRFVSLFVNKNSFLAICTYINKATTQEMTLEDFLNKNKAIKNKFEINLNKIVTQNLQKILSNDEIIKLQDLLSATLNYSKFKDLFGQTPFEKNLKNRLNQLVQDIVHVLENDEQSKFILDRNLYEQNIQHRKELQKLLEQFPPPKSILKKAAKKYTEEKKFAKALALQDYAVIMQNYKNKTSEQRKNIFQENHKDIFKISPETKPKNKIFSLYHRNLSKMEKIIDQAEQSYTMQQNYFKRRLNF